jgi:hypothetical protein
LEGGDAQWWPGRDQILMEQPTGLGVFAAEGRWKAPVRSIPAAKLPAAFNPDGAQAAYADEVQVGGMRTGRLCCVSTTGPARTPRVLATESGSSVIPFRWMGGEVLYWRDKSFSESIRADGLELLRVPAEANAARPHSLNVSTLVNEDFLSVAPGESAIAVAAGLGRDVCDQKRIARIEWPGGDVRYFTDERTAAVSPAWSPDGKWIAYSAATAVASGCGGGETMRRALAQRRIWTVPATGNASPSALTRDQRYRDEEPQWSLDGRHILFCRIDNAGAQTVWLMRADGTDAVQVAGPLDCDPSLAWFGYYGTINWRSRIDWHQARA